MTASARQTCSRVVPPSPSLRGKGLFLAVLVGCALGGCTPGATNKAAIPEVRLLAERDLDCAPKDIRIEEEWGGRFLAIGCGRKARYDARCDGGRCSVSEATGATPGWRDRPDPGP